MWVENLPCVLSVALLVHMLSLPLGCSLPDHSNPTHRRLLSNHRDPKRAFLKSGAFPLWSHNLSLITYLTYCAVVCLHVSLMSLAHSMAPGTSEAHEKHWLTEKSVREHLVHWGDLR